MMLFNKNDNGADELVNVLGLIDDDLTFSKWEPIVPLGIRELSSIIGSEVVKQIDIIYRNADDAAKISNADDIIHYAQQAVGMFTWIKVIPTMDAQHGNGGRQRRLTENETGLTGAQEFKDENNILNMAYEAVDALVELLEESNPTWWNESIKKRDIKSLLIKSKDEFDRYYTIGSSRLYLTLVPMIREVQETEIVPVITRNYMDKLLDGSDTKLTESILELCRRPLALLTIKKAVERLPIEVLPNGIVQVQQSATVRDKLKAETKARESVAGSLAADAEKMLDKLSDTVNLLMAAEDEKEKPDTYVPNPTIQSRGMTF